MANLEKYKGIIPAFYACYDEEGNVSPERVRALTEYHIRKGDMFQKRGDSNETLKYISSDINTILKLMNTLNITSVPSSVQIVHQNGEIYKQDSKIKTIK